MTDHSPGIVFAQNLYLQYARMLQQLEIASPPVFFINEHNLAATKFEALPELTRNIVDRLVDLADTDVEKFNQEMDAAVTTYRFFNIVERGNDRYAKIDHVMICLRALQMNPQDDVLLSAVLSMGRCTVLDGHGKRCRRRAVAPRLCAGHAPQNQPAPPPAAE